MAAYVEQRQVRRRGDDALERALSVGEMLGVVADVVQIVLHHGGDVEFVVDDHDACHAEAAIAADRLGRICAPLVCTDGMPAAAQRVLLTQLADAGAKLFYHGDFDWPGIHIANNVMRLCGATPWRFRSDDYSQAIESSPSRERDLSNAAATASWDSTLGTAMQSHGLFIPEEAVASLLIDDLRSLELRSS